MRPGATAVTSAAARPMLQLAPKVFDDSIIVRPWRKPATRWLASVSDALRRNPATGIAGCCALRERPRRRSAANQRDELAASHYPMPPVLPTERIAHLGTADCCIHPGRNAAENFFQGGSPKQAPPFPRQDLLTARNRF